MTKIISFKKDVLQDHAITSGKIVWKLMIRDNEAPLITILHNELTGLLINIQCDDFELINVLKDTALKEAQKNATALLEGEPITIRPTMMQGHLIHMSNGELMAQYS